MDRYDPVLLEKYEQLNYLSSSTFDHGNMDNREDALSIILQLRTLIPMNNILHRIIIKIESLLQIRQFLVGRALSINPQHLSRSNLTRKPIDRLRGSPI